MKKIDTEYTETSPIVLKEFDCKKLERMAHVLKIIAHPVRLRILLHLSGGASDVSGIHKEVSDGCQVSMLSHHLAKMKDNGILDSEKVGKQVYYRMVDNNILNLFKCMENCSIL